MDCVRIGTACPRRIASIRRWRAQVPQVSWRLAGIARPPKSSCAASNATGTPSSSCSMRNARPRIRRGSSKRPNAGSPCIIRTQSCSMRSAGSANAVALGQGADLSGGEPRARQQLAHASRVGELTAPRPRRPREHASCGRAQAVARRTRTAAALIPRLPGGPGGAALEAEYDDRVVRIDGRSERIFDRRQAGRDIRPVDLMSFSIRTAACMTR